MNILFLMKLMNMGGQEMVSITLANYFVCQGHNVVIASFEKPWDLSIQRTNSLVKYFTLGMFEYSQSNIQSLRKILIDEKINVVINQWGLPYIPAKVLNEAKKQLGIKVIAVYHNNPESNARLTNVDLTLDATKNLIKRIVLKVKKKAFKIITSYSMRYVYAKSDCYMVLSPCYVDAFKRFTGISNPQKLAVLTNPVTIDSSNFSFNIETKEKEIIYVGRIDYNQKRVRRVIDTWKYLEKKFPDWKLTIIGDGCERSNVEWQVKYLNLKNVFFEGFQQPQKYYERASILMLVSEYEGFPLVLPECMSYGVIPVVYGSFDAVYDVVANQRNGIVIPFSKKGYCSENMANELSKIMSSVSKRIVMAKNAMQTSKFFSIESIYASWLKEIEKLKADKLP